MLAKSHGQAEQGSCLVAQSCAARFVYFSASHFGFAHNFISLDLNPALLITKLFLNMVNNRDIDKLIAFTQVRNLDTISSPTSRRSDEIRNQPLNALHSGEITLQNVRRFAFMPFRSCDIEVWTKRAKNGSFQ